jgi:hypothetical protein
MMNIVTCYLVLCLVPSVHDFNNITSMFSDHMFDNGVPENNTVMLSKSGTEGTRDIKPDNM